MDVFDNNLLTLWLALNNNNVRYIMIGGFAVNYHGYIRNTEDIDLLLDDTPENRVKLKTTLEEIGSGDFSGIENMVFLPGWSSISITNGLELDIITELKGVNQSFNELLENAAIGEIENIKIPFLHLNQLIANKKNVGRAKDLLDVEQLLLIKKIKENKKS